MASRSKIALVAHDAGGARAVLPVALELQKHGWELVPFLAGPAVRVFGETLASGTVSDSMAQEEVVAMLQQQRAVALLSASGLYNTIEHTVRLAARQLKLPIVAVQDAWFSHTERYRRGGVESFPDLICAMDELSMADLESAGFSRPRLALTGHPGLERTVQRCRDVTPLQVHKQRQEFGLADDLLVLTFFSDPHYTGANGEFYSGPGAIMCPDGRGLYGYTVRDILPALLAELERALAAANTTAAVVVRPHPSECDAVLRELIARHPAQRIRVQVETRGSTENWIPISDALLGMMTIALLEAALAGKPAASIQLGLRESGQDDPCMANTLGYTEGVFDAAGLRALCEKLVQRDWAALRRSPRHALPIEGATRRVTDCLLRAARLA